MPYGLYISAEGAQAQGKRLEIISNNLANVDTVGFKREMALMQARHSEAIQRGLDYPGTRSINNIGGGVMVAGSATDFAPGAFERTGLPTDMAIQSDGFFVVQQGDKKFLTRAGNFAVNTAGRLVTREGDPVLTTQGTPVELDVNQPWRLVDGGRIEQGSSAQELAIVKPQQPGDLAKVGENLFFPLADTVPVLPGERDVASGYLERSAIRPAAEMMQLIEASRAFESNVSMIRTQDEATGALVNRVLGTGR
ncbi:MAG: flagellar hook basal-body protein [Planctomycetia bacterium]|nr:flagellar hook basal-body protein [Planctomycetia bacterium]